MLDKKIHKNKCSYLRVVGDSEEIDTKIKQDIDKGEAKSTNHLLRSLQNFADDLDRQIADLLKS